MVSNILATGVYHEPTLFTMPWPFYIVDNFLDDDLYKLLVGSRKHEHFKLVDSWDGGQVVTRNDTHDSYPKKMALPVYMDLAITQSVTNTIVNKLGSVINCDYFCKPDLIRCDPGYRYDPHRDHVDKINTIVVYLHPIMSDATILIDSVRNHYSVMWRQNRALIFTQESHGLHCYQNNTQYPRLTLNVYMSKEDHVYDVAINNRRA